MLAELYALGQPAEGQDPNILATLLPIIIIFAIMYFLLIRPQSKRQKEKQKMLEALKKGDDVVTSGGIYGTIEAIKDKENQVIVRVSKDTKLTMSTNSIASVQGKGQS